MFEASKIIVHIVPTDEFIYADDIKTAKGKIKWSKKVEEITDAGFQIVKGATRKELGLK